MTAPSSPRHPAGCGAPMPPRHGPDRTVRPRYSWPSTTSKAMWSASMLRGPGSASRRRSPSTKGSGSSSAYSHADRTAPVGADLRYGQGAAAGAAEVQGPVQSALVAATTSGRYPCRGARSPCAPRRGSVNFG